MDVSVGKWISTTFFCRGKKTIIMTHHTSAMIWINLLINIEETYFSKSAFDPTPEGARSTMSTICKNGVAN